ncbi:MAG: hypothetical protein IJH78_00225 [Clostridia bacterium]|nr:hypothetical protein [Clostridia bacterium]
MFSLGDWIAIRILVFVGRAFVWCFKAVLGGLMALLGLFIPGIGSVNRRNSCVVTMRRPVPVSQLLQGGTPGGKTIVSGDAEGGSLISPWRNTILAAAAARASQAGMGGVILHRGDRDLEARLQQRLGGGKTIFVTNGDSTDPKIYDPLAACARLDECVDILMEYQDDGSAAFNSAKDYLRGLLLYCNLVLKKRPTVALLNQAAGMRYTRLLDDLNDALAGNVITQAQYDSINDRLEENMTDGRNALRQRLNTLVSQLNGLLVGDNPPPPSARICIRKAVQNGRFLVVDLTGITNPKLCLGLLANELRMALRSGNIAAWAGFSDLPISDSEDLFRLLRAGLPGLGLCVSGYDLFAACSSSADKLNTLISGSECRVVFKHTGASATAWQNTFGKYKKKVVTETQSLGRTRGPFQLFATKSRTEGSQAVEQDEPKVLERDITQLNPGCVYAARQDTQKIMHCALADG